MVFFVFFFGEFCIIQILSCLKTFLHVSSVFFRSLIESFLSFAFFRFFIGNFLFVFFREQGLTFSPWVKVYGKLGCWLKAYRTAGHDIGFGQRFGDKGDVLHYFHDTHATMMITNFYARLVMHAPMWTLKHQVFMVM